MQLYIAVTVYLPLLFHLLQPAPVHPVHRRQVVYIDLLLHVHQLLGRKFARHDLVGVFHDNAQSLDIQDRNLAVRIDRDLELFVEVHLHRQILLLLVSDYREDRGWVRVVIFEFCNETS